MRAEGTRLASGSARAILAAMTCGLLASCTTAGNDLSMGQPAFSGIGVAPIMEEVAAEAAAGGFEATADPANVAVSDAPLPDQVASVPAERPWAGSQAAVTPAAAGQQTAEVSPQAEPDGASDAAAAASSSPDASIASNAAAPAEAVTPPKRGFFASLFSSPPAKAASQKPAAQAKPDTPADEVMAQPAEDPSAEQAPAPERAPQAAAMAKAEPASIEADTRADAAVPTPAEPAAETAEAAPQEETATQVAVATPSRKRGFLASLFSAQPQAAPAQTAFAPAQGPASARAAAAPAEETEPEAKSEPLIERTVPEEKVAALIDLEARKPIRRSAEENYDALPGVRQTMLFEIRHKSGIDDDSDVDLYEGESAPVVLASAAGLARLAPNGLLKQRDSVDTACLKPSLVRILKTVERHFGKRLIVTSGYRSPSHNRRVRGAPRSQHMYCAAADVQLPGVSKWELARFVRNMPGRGGVGTYCHTSSVHIDVGPERDWNWRCRQRKS